MKSNSFLRNRKALTALLLCTGFVATQPFSVMAEEIVTAVQTVQQQKQSVSGTIKDPAGEPVIGASILEKGTTNGTITDFDGNFTLNVAPGATLVISYIGYKNQEMKVIPGKSLNIILQEDTETLGGSGGSRLWCAEEGKSDGFCCCCKFQGCSFYAGS